MLHRRIDLAAPTGRTDGIVAAALPMPAGWERGVTFDTTGCVTPFTVGECPGAVHKQAHRPGHAAFAPFTVGAGLTCTTAGGVPPGDAGAVLGQVLEAAAGRELATAAATKRDHPDGGPGNPSLTRSVTYDHGDAADLTTALACLEAHAAAAMAGRPVWLHVAPDVATRMAAARLMWRDGTRWRTPAGSRVVVSPGYVLLPLPSTVTVTTAPIFATGPVYGAVGHRAVLEDVDRATNDTTTVAEDLAILAFDPCYVAVVGTGATPCTAPTPHTPAVDVYPTLATAGTPGTFTNPGQPGATIDIPDMAELSALGPLGNTDAWTAGQYVLLEDGTTKVHWSGTGWANGEAAARAATAPTSVTPGQPGSFGPPGADVPDDLAALQTLGALGQSAAWSADAFVALDDGTFATWDGSAWQAGVAPAPPAPPADDGPCVHPAPPITGPGSGTDAWRQHFTDVHPDVDTDGLSRDAMVSLHDTITGTG